MQIEFGGCRGSQHYKPDYFARRLDFRREEGILLMSWFKQDEFRISAFTSIHAAFVASDLRNSPSQCISAQDHSSLSVDNLLTHYNDNIPADFIREATLQFSHLNIKDTNNVSGIIILIYIERMKLK